MTFEDKSEIVINQLRADRDRLQNLVDNHIAELEKIKAEILNFIGGMNMCNDLDNEAFKKLDIRIDGIFDEHISELKGENNANSNL